MDEDFSLGAFIGVIGVVLVAGLLFVVSFFGGKEQDAKTKTWVRQNQKVAWEMYQDAKEYTRVELIGGTK